MKNLSIRVDDFPGTKPEEFWKHNLENYKKFHQILNSRKLHYVLGVIPRHVTDEQLEWLGDNGVHVVLHGVDHDERFLNEFREYQTESEITDVISKQLRRFEVFCDEVRGYIPPHNVIDQKTCRALLSNGISYLFGGPGTAPFVAKYANDIGLQYIQSDPPHDYGRSDELLVRGAVDSIADRLSKSEDVWLTLHWTWEMNIGFDHLVLFLDTLIERCGILGLSNG